MGRFSHHIQECRPTPLPDFSTEEQFLINHLKSPESCSNSSSYRWGYLKGAAVIAGFGTYHNNAMMVLAGFVIGFRLYEERLQSIWTAHWRSINEKYEAASSANPNTIATDPTQESQT